MKLKCIQVLPDLLAAARGDGIGSGKAKRSEAGGERENVGDMPRPTKRNRHPCNQL